MTTEFAVRPGPCGALALASCASALAFMAVGCASVGLVESTGPKLTERLGSYHSLYIATSNDTGDPENQKYLRYAAKHLKGRLKQPNHIQLEKTLFENVFIGPAEA